MKSHHSLALFLVSAALFQCGDSTHDPDSIVGSWHCNNFMIDGKIGLEIRQVQPTVLGDYIDPDGDVYPFDYADFTDSVLTVRFVDGKQAGELVLTFEDNTLVGTAYDLYGGQRSFVSSVTFTR